MEIITLIHHTDGKRTAVYNFDTVANGSGIDMVTYPEIPEHLLDELRKESTTPARVQEILSLL